VNLISHCIQFGASASGTQNGGSFPRLRSSGDSMSDKSSDRGVAICREGTGDTACSMDEDSDMSGEERGMLSAFSEKSASASANSVSSGGPIFKQGQFCINPFKNVNCQIPEGQLNGKKGGDYLEKVNVKLMA